MRSSSKVNATDAYGRTALHIGAERGQVGFVRELLEKGANVNVKDHWGFTPLHNAAISGDTDLITSILAKGADINAHDDMNAIPLHYAAQSNRKGAIELLIKKGSRIDIRDIFDQTPLDWVAANGSPESLAPFAAKEGESGINLEDMLNHAPVHNAAYRGHTMIMEILLGKGAQLEAGDDDGRIPLHWAAKGGDKSAVELLISKGSQVNARDNAGRTPLHEAALNGHNGVIELLLEKGSDINAVDKQGSSPLHFAFQYGREKSAKLLIEKGAENEKKPAPAALLKKELNQNQAIMWHLGHCGWAVKTKNHLLIFDYWQRNPRPTNACLANGYIDPNEIKDLDVTVFVTHAHPDHYDKTIFQWEPLVKNITYIFGWQAKTEQRYIYMKKTRAKQKIKGMKIFTINCKHDNIPEVAYLVMVDGLIIYHSGDYVGPIRSFKNDIDYLAKKCDGVDIAFASTNSETGYYTMERLLPKAAFPMHLGGMEFMYKGIVRTFGSKYPKTKFIAPENRGDRYLYQNKEITQLL